MNFLAHLFLAGPPHAAAYADRLVGQFVADAVPGRRLEAYAHAPGVQAGIRQHRAIDAFTDQHPVVRRATARLRLAGHGKYAGVASDVFFDHFLARGFAGFSAEALPDFTRRVYAQLGARQAEFPARVQQFFPHLVQHDWLGHYAEVAGVARALAGLSRRASPGSGLERGGAELVANYAAYEGDFQEFFPELQAFAAAGYPGP